jgi:hypothetical protein
MSESFSGLVKSDTLWTKPVVDLSTMPTSFSSPGLSSNVFGEVNMTKIGGEYHLACEIKYSIARMA